MNNGKGLPEQAEVKAVLAWPEWKDENGQFSMERFRAFSSMNSWQRLARTGGGKSGAGLAGMERREWPVQYGAVPRFFIHE